MTFDTSSLLNIKSLQVALRYPSSILGYLSQGKIGAFRTMFSNVLQQLSGCSDREIDESLELTKKSSSLVMPEGLRIFDPSFELTNLVMLYYLTRVFKPRLVFETGVWTGKTSWSILQAMEDIDRGQLVSIDLGMKVTGTSKLPISEIGGLVPYGLRDRWRLVIDDAKLALPKLLSETGPVDIFYHDSDHLYEHMMFEYTTVLNSLSKDGILCSDDVLLNNAFAAIKLKLVQPGIIGNRFGYGLKRYL